MLDDATCNILCFTTCNSIYYLFYCHYCHSFSRWIQIMLLVYFFLLKKIRNKGKKERLQLLHKTIRWFKKMWPLSLFDDSLFSYQDLLIYHSRAYAKSLKNKVFFKNDHRGPNEKCDMYKHVRKRFHQLVVKNCIWCTVSVWAFHMIFSLCIVWSALEVISIIFHGIYAYENKSSPAFYPSLELRK